MGNIENSSLGSVSDHDPLNNLIDHLYYLKSSLIKNNSIDQESSSFFQQICNLIEAKPELAKPLYKWKFLEKELLYFLKSNKFCDSLELATSIISINKSVPNFFLTRKFLFFISDKLYLAIKGNSSNNEKFKNIGNQLSDISNIDALLSQIIDENNLNNLDIPTSQIDLGTVFPSEDSNPPKEEHIDTDVVRIIMNFISEIISIHRSTVNILHEFCFFELSNLCILTETAKMFDSVFAGISFPYQVKSSDSKEIWTKDGLYEVRRKYFEPEVIFRNKETFIPKTLVENLSSGIYLEIYNTITNIRDFADISLNSFLNVLLYKKINYSSSDLENLIIEGKNEKAFRVYRRALESGLVSNPSLLNSIIKAIDNDSLSREAVLCLYFYLNDIEKTKLFTETRIRTIFQCLEYQCEFECPNKTQKKIRTEESRQKISEEFHQNFTHSFNSNLATTQIFGNSCDNGLFEEPILVKTENMKSILEDFGEFENGSFKETEESIDIDKITTLSCKRKMVLSVIKHLYTIVQKEFFYKPSYLILMAYSLRHNPEDKDFILGYFKDFLSYCKLDSKNIAKLFLSSTVKESKPKVKKYTLENSDYEPDFYGIKEKNENPIEVETPVIKKESLGVKLVKNVIESDEE